MDVDYVNKVECVKKCLEKTNPPGFLLEEEELNEWMLLCDDPLNLKEEQKRFIKKKFLDWCKKYHPDKTDNVEEDIFYIYKEFGDTFLRFTEEKYESVWMYMCYSSVTFHNPI